MIGKKIRWIFSIFIIPIFFISNNFIINAADMNSILELLKQPIYGITLPENVIAQARSYLLSHPDIDYNALELEVINAKAIIQEAAKGKKVNSIADIVSSISAEQKGTILSRVQSVANNAKVSVALGQDETGKDTITVVDKSTGSPVFAKEFIIKATGRENKISYKTLISSFFIVMCLIEVIFVFEYRYYKDLRNEY